MTTDSYEAVRTSDDPPKATYLAGHLAPVPDEISAVDLPVTGSLPPELAGRYLRNGPNPLPGEESGHWFTGHGMLHGIRLRDGRAEWYRNRWVRTARLAGESSRNETGERNLAAHTANTHIVEHGGKLLALCEGGLPYEMTRELDTIGPCDFGGRLTTAMTAHPKRDPVTGELFFFGYAAMPPFLTYHHLSTTGELVRSEPIDVPGPTMMHDFAITEHYVIWLDLPLTFDFDLVDKGMPYQWNDGYGARLGIMPRSGGSDDVRWIEIEPCYVFHVGNAREDARGRIVLDAVRYDRVAWHRDWSRIGGEDTFDATRTGDLVEKAASTGVSSLHRWTVDLTTGTVSEQGLDDRGVEFPTLNDERIGRDNRFLYTVAAPLDATASAEIIKYDVPDGTRSLHPLRPGSVAGEAVFVPARDAKREDDGWLLSIVTDQAGSGSELVVMDATAITAPPVATIALPRAVPTGFHGSWIPDAVGGVDDGNTQTRA